MSDIESKLSRKEDQEYTEAVGESKSEDLLDGIYLEIDSVRSANGMN